MQSALCFPSYLNLVIQWGLYNESLNFYKKYHTIVQMAYSAHAARAQNSRTSSANWGSANDAGDEGEEPFVSTSLPSSLSYSLAP